MSRGVGWVGYCSFQEAAWFNLHFSSIYIYFSNPDH